MIPLIEREVIDRRRWIERQEFLDLLTIAQSAPGPISLNTSVFVGYKLRGYAGPSPRFWAWCSPRTRSFWP